MINKNTAGDLEFSNSTLAFEMPVLVHNGNEIVLDEFDSVVYQGAKYTITTVNDLGQIEINELMVIHDGTTAFARPVATLNSMTANTFISTFRSELLRGKVRVFVTSTGNKNKTRFFKVMFKR